MTGPTGQQPFTSAEDAQRFIVQIVYDHFRQTGEWPRVRDLDLDYGEVLDPVGGLELLCRQVGHERISCGSPTSEHDRVILTIRSIAECKGSEDDVRNFLAAVRLAARRYREKRGQEVDLLTENLATELELDEAAAKRALELLGMAKSLTQGRSPGLVRLAHPVSRL